MKLSHSAIEKYKTCPKMYKLHYIDKIREITTHSPLVFGSAMDGALNLLLETKDLLAAKTKLCEELDKLITNEIIIRYLKTDFDVRLLEENDLEYLKKLVFDDIVTPQKSELTQFVNEANLLVEPTPSERALLNILQKMCLKVRGTLMLEAYEREVLPKISNVHNIQRQIVLKNEEGDELIGFVDYMAEMDGSVTIIDNKTSGRPYPDDSVLNSQQFGIYCEAEGIPNAAYVVLLKNVRFSNENTCSSCGNKEISRKKICPVCSSTFTTEIKKSVDVQIVSDVVNERNQEALFGAIDIILNKIKNEEFEEDWSKCANQFGRPCPYYEYCRNGNMKGLIKKEE